MTHEYGISGWSKEAGWTRTTSSQIIAELDRSIPLQLAHIRAVEEMERKGPRYSNHDGDVLSAANCVAREGRTEIRPWEAKWVEAMVGA